MRTSMTSKTETTEGAVAEYVTADDRRPVVRPADLAGAGRVHAGTADAGAAVVRRDRRRAQSARPHRHRGRHARPARPAQERRRQAADGGRRRPARRILWPADRPDRRSAAGLPDDGREENPVNLDPRMAKLAGGVHRLDGQLMVVLDVDRVLEIVPDMLAA